jgi:hypothetical protein
LKKLYKVAIEEAVVQEFLLYADNVSDAIEIGVQKYKSGEFVLEPGEVTHKLIAVFEPIDEATEWIEF